MDEAIKKFIYTSVGLVAQTTNKIQEMINELIRDRKISEEEGKRIVEDFTSRTKSQSKELEEQVRSFSSKITREASTTPEQEIRQLREKVKMLEERINRSGSSQSIGSNMENRYSDIAEEHSIENEQEPLHEKKELFQQKLDEKAAIDQADTVDKVAQNKHVNLNDEVLTPDKKIEAEKQRMQNYTDRPSSDRSEKDTQKTNLGGPILTPGHKVEQDSKDAE